MDSEQEDSESGEERLDKWTLDVNDGRNQTVIARRVPFLHKPRRHLDFSANQDTRRWYRQLVDTYVIWTLKTSSMLTVIVTRNAALHKHPRRHMVLKQILSYRILDELHDPPQIQKGQSEVYLAMDIVIT